MSGPWPAATSSSISMTPNTMAMTEVTITASMAGGRPGLAEGGEAERHAHVADIAPGGGDALQAHARRGPPSVTANSRVDSMPTAKVASTTRPKPSHQGRVEHRRDRRARQGAEEQHRQGEIAHEGVQRRGRLAAQDAPAAGQIARQDDPEDRQGDVEDGLHGLRISAAVND